MRKVIAEAPVRIDLAGGTLDIPPLYLFHPGSVTINIGIELKAIVTITEADQTEIISHDQDITATWKNPEEISLKEYPRLELLLRIIKSFNSKENLRVEVKSEIPAGSGLGGSSVIAIALTTALSKWFGREFSKDELVEYARTIETETIKVPAGYQDYWGAVYGGINAYQMGKDGKVILQPLGSKQFHKKLEEHMILVYTGKPHFSGTNNWELFKKHVDGDQVTVSFFETLKDNALKMKSALEAEDINLIADALNTDWQTRKQMLPGMTTPEIEKLTEKVMKNGAQAIRVCGAGGGGCALIIINPEKRKTLSDIIKNLGMDILPVQIREKGVQII